MLKIVRQIAVKIDIKPLFFLFMFNKSQKNQKNFQKSVDKRDGKWYNIQAVAESPTARSLKIEQQTKKYKLDSR